MANPEPFPASFDITRPTYAVINFSRLRENLAAIREKVSPSNVMLILKANAYGHGIIEVANHFCNNVDLIGVALPEEGVRLREAGITIPILVMGGILENQIPMFFRHGLIFSCYSIELLEKIDTAAKTLGLSARVHLKIDTGMERLGVHYYEAGTLLEAALHCKNIFIEGVFSHFANADSSNLAHARLQLERFNETLRFYEHHSLPMPKRHMANSAAVLQLPESYFDIVRPGILFYGIYPSSEISYTVTVRPALEWKSHVVHFKEIRTASPISYGSTWQSDHPVHIATIPVGYGDGYFRSMSNRVQVIIRGKKYSQAGTICMDQMMVNLENDTAQVGDEVILLGEAGDQSITADELAKQAATIPYEILTNINTRVPRVYVDY